MVVYITLGMEKGQAREHPPEPPVEAGPCQTRDPIVSLGARTALW